MSPSEVGSSGSDQRWNQRNPAVKRILRELREIQEDDNPDIVAQALEENIFEWCFAIRGAWGTEFEGGIYHGRILMPSEYPFKPPSFVMITPSGRFETGTKICLSISSYHPESWQPSWSVQSALVALIAFMQTPGNGSIGSLDTPADVRRQMATEAREKPPVVHSNAEKQIVVDELHARMLEMEEQSRIQYEKMTRKSDEAGKENQVNGREDECDTKERDGAQPLMSPASIVEEPSVSQEDSQRSTEDDTVAMGSNVNENAMTTSTVSKPLIQVSETEEREMPPTGTRLQSVSPVRGRSTEDALLTVAAVILTVILFVILLKKVFVFSQTGIFWSTSSDIVYDQHNNSVPGNNEL